MEKLNSSSSQKEKQNKSDEDWKDAVLSRQYVIVIRGTMLGPYSRFYRCAIGRCQNDNSLEIPSMSVAEFEAKGWILTEQRTYCNPEKDHVAICPHCAKNYFKK